MNGGSAAGSYTPSRNTPTNRRTGESWSREKRFYSMQESGGAAAAHKCAQRIYRLPFRRIATSSQMPMTAAARKPMMPIREMP